jgi:hypothetical protein
VRSATGSCSITRPKVGMYHADRTSRHSVYPVAEHKGVSATADGNRLLASSTGTSDATYQLVCRYTGVHRRGHRITPSSVGIKGGQHCNKLNPDQHTDITQDNRRTRFQHLATNDVNYVRVSWSSIAMYRYSTGTTL